jgi:N-acetylmuramoyl-L-alanine amidase
MLPSTALASDAKEPGLLGRKIVIDAGHGGPDSGARGVTGIHEKDVTLNIALKLATLLRQSGAQVFLTRESDRDLATASDRVLRQRQRGDLKARVNIVLEHHPDLFISIHCNAAPSPTWHGAQTLYQDGNEAGKEAAVVIQESFQEHLFDTDREPQSAKRLFVLRKVHRPAVLAEVGFLTNPTEEQFLQTDVYQERVAIALYMGTMRFFGEPRATWWQELKAAISGL